MTNDEYIELKQSELLCDTEPLSPEKEAEWRNAFERVLTKNAELLEEVADLKQQLAWFKKQVYGQKSEKTEVIIEGGEQVHMFNEAENESTVDPKRIEESITVAEHKRKAKSTHAETFENLPIEEVVHEVEDRTCPECGSEMETIGKEFVRDEVVFVPARLFVRKHYTEVVKCPECGNDESKDDTLPDVPAPVFKEALI